MKELIAELKSRNVFLSVDKEELVVDFDGGDLSHDLISKIRDNKLKLISYLGKYDNRPEYTEIPVLSSSKHYPISDAQRRLWVLSQFEGGSVAYNIPVSICLNQEIEIKSFKRAIDATVNRHEILRTVFREEETGEIRQWVLGKEELGFAIDYLDLRGDANRKEKVESYISEDAYRSFDLAKGPLLRAALLQVEEEGYVFYFNLHHIVSDGWSMRVLFKDVFNYYEAYRAGEEPVVEELKIQYKDYSAWQLAQLDQKTYKAHKGYWLDKLSGALALLDLPTNKKRPNVKTYNGYRLATYLDKATTAKLREYTQEKGGSLFMGLLASWNVLLYRYTSQQDIIVGTPVAGREHADLEDQIGFYVNMLVLRNEVDPEESFNRFYQRLKEESVQSYSHQMYPFDRLVEELDLQRDTSRSAVFDVLLALQNNGEKIEGVQLSESELNQTVDRGYSRSKFDLEITFQERGDYLSLNLVFNPDVYEKAMIEGLIRHYKQLLCVLLATPEEKISQVDYLAEQEKYELLETFNDTAVAYPKDKTIVDLFEEQVARTPDKVAVVFEDRELTYQELDERSTQLAHYLRDNYDIQPDDLIGIQLNRSEWLIVSILGVLKAGGAYVPIDPEYPSSRKEYIVKDSSLDLLITETSFIYDIDYYAGDVFAIDVEFDSENYIAEDLSRLYTPGNLAYVIYTSGSTGMPKGVMVEHASLINYLKWGRSKYSNDTSALNFGLFTSLSFDLTVTSIYLPLISGGELTIFNSIADVSTLVRGYFESEINCIKLTPAHVGLLGQLGLKITKVQVAIIGGDKLEDAHVGILRELNPAIRIYNEYGPTESTVGCTTKEIGFEKEANLIGCPISNTSIYIVNEKDDLQPVGVSGEILIGGDQVARGYLNREALTKEKFIASPFKAGERLYRTGDLGRWLPDGNIAFMGRKDDQVKIRGYRIEPREIEHALLSHEEINEAVVVARANQSGEKELVAYITSRTDQNARDLRAWLEGTLPAYMVPAYFVQLEAMPLTANGKIDKGSLPDPAGQGLSGSAGYVAARNETEAKLVKIWEEVLQRENIGVHDDFFVLGGHSLKAVRLSNAYQKELAVKMPLKELFAHTSIASQAALIASSTQGIFIQIEKVALQASYPISDGQRRLWVLSQFEGGSAAYNIPGSLKLNGKYEPALFERSFDSLIERHEILRTVFREDATGEIRQWVLGREALGFAIDYRDLSGDANGKEKAAAYIAEDTYRSFDLARGPLLRAALLRIKEEGYIFCFNMHHIISDGWSMEVLSKDVLHYYEAYRAGKEPGLEELRIQYKDYSAWQSAQLDQETYKTHKAYWLDQLSGELPLLDLPTSKQRPKVKTYNGYSLTAWLDKATTAKLKEYTQEKGGSLFMGLLASWNVLLYRYTSQQDILIGTPVAGREHADLEDQIGFYVNTLVLRNEVDPEESFNRFYQGLKEGTLKSYSHQMYPFDRLVEELDLQRDTSRSAVFDVLVTLQNNGEKIEGVTLSKEELDQTVDRGYRRSKFDIAVTFQETGDYLSLNVVFNPDVYEKVMIEGLIRHYKQLLSGLLATPEEKISQVEYLSPQEKHELLVTFNDTAVAYPKDKTIVDLFEEQVARTPDNVAIVFEDRELTYRELDERSNQLAHYLSDNYDIQPDDLIGIQLNRSEWMIVSILGVLKAGGAYVPIDPEYPQERIDYIQADTRCKVCLDEGELTRFKAGQKAYSIEQPTSNTKSDHLVYVMYTSGSTGKPKGVMVEHRSVVNLIYPQQDLFAIDPEDKILQFSTFTFDPSVEQMWLALLNGCSLVLIDKQTITDTAGFNAYMAKHGVTHLHATPSFLENMELSQPNNVKRVVSGGEECKRILANKFCHRYKFYNKYGPTEVTVTSTINLITSQELERVHVSIGKPIGNFSIYVLGKQMELLPIGVSGELYIGGAGLARGYLNQEDLTAEKFIKNPFKEEERLYRTGDFGRWLPDGNIEFLGRIDDQVKIRGYRIELGEIEHALLSYEKIKQAAVLAKENESGEKELVAYVTADLEQNTTDLRGYLKEKLPAYMVPVYFVQLQAMPLTANGKIAKKLFPDPEGMGLTSGAEYVAPRNELDEKLAKIWEEVLQRKNIGIDEGFFDAGGNSIKLIALKSKIWKEFNRDWPLASLFEFNTIRKQGDSLSGVDSEEGSEDFVNQNSILRRGGNQTDIAVIGMSIRVPRAKNISEFWENLRMGRECVTHFTREELLSYGISKEKLNNEDYVRASSFLENKECFDSGFFGYILDEAKLMDPQTRIFHEVVWSALEDSGYDPFSYKGLIGLFAGAGNNLRWQIYSLLKNENKINSFQANHLMNKDFLNTLIAHKLKLRGPVQYIDTACSTSLVAIHQAVLSLLSGESHIAIAGGVSIKHKSREEGYLYEESMILSKDGYNRTFDREASGTIGSEGAGAVVLKRLSDAIRDGDQIYAVIKGSAVNNDGGRKVGYTAPSVNGQAEVIQMAYRAANVTPESVSYVEAHGTATKLGDPIEIRALTQAFGKSEDKYCAIGSVKTNLGHLDTAAGVAGFIKTVLCLKNKKLVSSLHFKSPNPEINFEESPFYVNSELREWKNERFPLRAGVSSFGIGGTNAHVILEASPVEVNQTKELSPQLITLSAKTPQALIRQQEQLKEYLKSNRELNLIDVAWTLQNRHAFDYRVAFVAEHLNEIIESLESKSGIAGKFFGRRKIAYMFSGGGSQYENMGRGLYEDHKSVFRKTMDRCFELARMESSIDFKGTIYPDESGVKDLINETINMQPLLFMFEYALAKQLEYYGIVPDIMIGHSIGEYAAACFSGVLTLEAALKLVIKRGVLMQSLPKGDMLAVSLSAAQVEGFLSPGVDIAAINTAESCVVSGESSKIAALCERFEKEGIFSKVLHISHASHSQMMDPILDKLTSIATSIPQGTPKIPYISNITGRRIGPRELTKTYWSDHLRGTVNFSAGIGSILSEGDTILIEVGPGNTLGTLARQHFKSTESTEVQQLVRHPKSEVADVRFMFDKLSGLWESGLCLNWAHLQEGKPREKVFLPTYSFEPSKYPMATALEQMVVDVLSKGRSQKREDTSDWFYESSWRRSRLLPETKQARKASTYLIFCDNCGIAEMLIGRIKENENVKIVRVTHGTDFEQLDDFTFRLNYKKEENYLDLIERLEASSLLPEKIVHLWNFSNKKAATTYKSTLENMDLGYYSLLSLAKSIGQVSLFHRVSIYVITSFAASVNEEDIETPARSAVLGPVLTIPKEYRNIECRQIDIKPLDKTELILRYLFDELNTEYSTPCIAYRQTTRWSQFYDPVKLSSNNTLPTQIKNGGVYLITGGMGGMGLVFSEYLAKEYNAKLILTGRKPASDLITSTLKKISDDVIYLNVDVSDAEQMEIMVSEAENQFGRIDGIFHTAGIGDYAGIIQNRTREESEEVFGAKIYGTIALYEIARKRAVNFLVLCSSAASALARFGQVAYTTANIFQDSFARSNNKGLFVYSIGWDTWSETGMAIYASLAHKEKYGQELNLRHGLTNAEGLEVLRRVLGYGIPSLSIFTRDLSMVLGEVEPDLNVEMEEVQVVQERTAFSNDYEAPETEAEKGICALFERYFGIKEIGIKDDYFDLGMDSLKAMRLVALIHQKINIQLKINDILENTNIHDLGRKIDLVAKVSLMKRKSADTQFEHELEI